jgi:hypothetical protein
VFYFTVRRHHLIQKVDWLQRVQEYDLRYSFEPKDITDDDDDDFYLMVFSYAIELNEKFRFQSTHSIVFGFFTGSK